ncbi:unnamed protein product [Ilex paraguariensis]|uniref:Uncharacterized protein n=1 Tax=Ilex paraguariensis TaxID=185542 RepID=A0ABC8QY65_9AQUA
MCLGSFCLILISSGEFLKTFFPLHYMIFRICVVVPTLWLGSFVSNRKDVKGIMNTLQLIREEVIKDGNNKDEETISRSFLLFFLDFNVFRPCVHESLDFPLSLKGIVYVNRSIGKREM